MYGNFYLGYYGSWFKYVLPALMIAFIAQIAITSTYQKYSKVRSKANITGAQLAKLIMNRNNLDLTIERSKGQLSDHYDPRTKVIRLSPEVYDGKSISSLAIAAHEVGHAMQDDQGYLPLSLRNRMVPIVNLGASLVWVFIFMGMLISQRFIEIGLALFLFSVIFQIITLPVEFNASRRALVQLGNGILTYEELPMAKSVLISAAFTYIAATLVSIGEFLRLLSLTNRGNRN